MNRLTTVEEYPHGAEGKNVAKLTGYWCRGVFEATACVEKLARYENTGLEPEELQELDRLYLEKCQEVTELKKRLEWIQVTERLPEGGEEVQVTVRRGYVDIGYYDESREEWWASDDSGLMDVIAWKPMSEPYQPAD